MPAPTITIRGSRCCVSVVSISEPYACRNHSGKDYLRPVIIVVVAQQFLGVVVGVGPRLAVVEVWWGDPLGVAVPVFAGCPALFGERVVTGAAECQIVDVGGVGLCPR